MSSLAAHEESCDVLIVGFGPVGAAIAALLGRYGVRTIVVDREEGIFMAPRAITLDNEALRVLQQVGLSDTDFERVRIPRVRMRCPHVGEFVSVDMSGEIDGHPKLVTFFQPDLERALRSLVASCSSVRVCVPVELVGFEDEGASVLASLREVASNRRMTVRAKYLIGADGARSRVRGAIGQDARGKQYDEDWLVVDARGVPGAIDHVEFYCDPRRPTPHMPAPGGRVRWEFMLRPGESRQAMESEDRVRALIAPWTGGADVIIERKAVYRFSAHVCERFRVGRAFLAGDAAHLTPPFAGQGLVAGLRDAANLAWKLAWAVKEQAAASVLDSYDQERRPHAVSMVALARFMGSLIMPRSRAQAVVVHGAAKALRAIGPVRAYIDKLGMKPKMCYPKGLYVRGRGALKRGGLFPQVHVRLGEQATALSDDVLGPGLSFVGLNVDPSAVLGPASRAAWARVGGTLAAFDAGSVRAGDVSAAETLGAPLARSLRQPWCFVVRPDRTILHDGPAASAQRVVEESISLLRGSP